MSRPWLLESEGAVVGLKLKVRLLEIQSCDLLPFKRHRQRRRPERSISPSIKIHEGRRRFPDRARLSLSNGTNLSEVCAFL